LDFERVKEAAMHIILGYKKKPVQPCLENLAIDSSADRRKALCLKFGNIRT
jgi:hypothetical protein